jgi:hypothetical protein
MEHITTIEIGTRYLIAVAHAARLLAARAADIRR